MPTPPTHRSPDEQDGPSPNLQAAALPPHARRPRRPDVRHTAHASAEIRRLKCVRSVGFTFAELQAEQAARSDLPGGPVLDVALRGADGVDHRLGRVRRLERALELALDPEPDHRQRLLNALPE